jgi:hypothetical protein
MSSLKSGFITFFFGLLLFGGVFFAWSAHVTWSRVTRLLCCLTGLNLPSSCSLLLPASGFLHHHQHHQRGVLSHRRHVPVRCVSARSCSKCNPRRVQRPSCSFRDPCRRSFSCSRCHCVHVHVHVHALATGHRSVGSFFTSILALIFLAALAAVSFFGVGSLQKAKPLLQVALAAANDKLKKD